jgi:hypothetical protein
MKLSSIIGYGMGVLLFTSFSINVAQWYKTNQINLVSEVNRDRSRINEDALNEILLQYMDNVRNNTIEQAKQSGKLEGILAVAYRAAPQENEYSAVWHGGYERGLEQTKFIGEMEYEKGYAAGVNKGREDYLRSINNILDSKEDFKTALKEFVAAKEKEGKKQEPQNDNNISPKLSK